LTVFNGCRDEEVVFDFTHGRVIEGCVPEIVTPDGSGAVPPPWGIHQSLLLDASDRLKMLDTWDRVTLAFHEIGGLEWQDA
jgi:hypothetical protein